MIQQHIGVYYILINEQKETIKSDNPGRLSVKFTSFRVGKTSLLNAYDLSELVTWTRNFYNRTKQQWEQTSCKKK